MTPSNPIDELIEKLPTGYKAGPWTANLHHTQFSHGRTYGFIDAGAVVPIAAVTLGVEGMPQDEGRANAALIALAPAMAAALSTLQEQKRKLEEALRDFLENPLFQVAVGGNPIVVDEMLARNRALLGDGA